MDTIKYSKIEKRFEGHPCSKPLGLMSDVVNRYSDDGDTIFDPFMGSGTTGVACVELQRNFIGCEIDPGYYAIAEKRISQAALQIPMFENVPR
jgi:site-specific DNA-methyltransferase (adenine-specific)